MANQHPPRRERGGRPGRRTFVIRCTACEAAVTLRPRNGYMRVDRVCRKCGAVGTVRVRRLPTKTYRKLRRRRAADNSVSMPAGTLRQKAAILLDWCRSLRATAAKRARNRDHRRHAYRRAARLLRVAKRILKSEVNRRRVRW